MSERTLGGDKLSLPLLKFQCSQCGACCRKAGKLGLMPQREDGACLYLGQDNLCTIYETRPEICRVDKMYEKYKFKISKKDYFKLNSEFCNLMIEEESLSKDYLIDISLYDRLEDGSSTA